MGLFGKIIGLTIAGTACNAVSSKMGNKRAEREKQNFESLAKLKELYDSGAITEKEYKRKKQEILTRY